METSIFHTGDLNSGITRAIQESKVVLCLIRADDDHWSSIWEDIWLSNRSHAMDMLDDGEPPLAMILNEKAVLLRLDYGTQEAEFLSAFCPIETAPTIVVIHNGQVLEKLEGGIAKEEFREKLLQACGFKGKAATASQSAEQRHAESLQDAEEAAAFGIPQSEDDIQAMFDERAQRLEAEKKKREAEEKAQRGAQAKARRKEAEDSAAQSSSSQPPALNNPERDKQQARDQWIVQQKQRKDEAKKERERILNQIEHDKQERKAQKERSREAHVAAGAGSFSTLPNTGHSSASPSVHPQSSCALQVRLFDGSSIRSKFAPDTTLALAVRTWVGEASPKGGADIPYTFRQILAPQPSRTIEVSEEHQTLWDLGLAPSATLVLVPVAGFTNAYANGGGGYLASAWNLAYGCASTVGGIVGSIVSYVPGVGGLYLGGTNDARQEQDEGAANTPADARAGASAEARKVNTLFDKRSQPAGRDGDRPATFYNGNSSAFQGRGQDDDDS